TGGNYNYFTTGANGCADTATLHLTINNGVHTDTTVVACGSFTWTAGTGTTYTTGGNYNFFSTGANGCADTATLHLTINNGVHTDTTVVACGSFTWTAGTGTTYTTGGNYNFFSTGANGCADTATLHLTINNGVHTDTTVVACSSYTWTTGTGTTYTASGNYNYFTTGANGCPDTATLHLTINNGVHTDTTVVACSSYTWTTGTGTTYTASGNYNYFTTGANGCPDTATLHLTINNGVHTDTTVVACSSYTWTSGTGTTYTASGNYDFFTIGVNGCADTATLHLTINNGVHTDTTVVACSSYTWTTGTGTTYTIGGDYDYISGGGNGCADTVTLHLTINNGVHTDTTVIACGSFTWTSGTGTTYTASGNYNYFTTGANGCPDTATLHLTINNGIHTYTTVVACSSYTC